VSAESRVPSSIALELHVRCVTRAIQWDPPRHHDFAGLLSRTQTDMESNGDGSSNKHAKDTKSDSETVKPKDSTSAASHTTHKSPKKRRKVNHGMPACEMLYSLPWCYSQDPSEFFFSWPSVRAPSYCNTWANICLRACHLQLAYTAAAL
jgi:hypothetical protein